MSALRAKKDKDGNLVSNKNSAGGSSANFSQMAMELTRQVANAKAGDMVAGQKITPAAILEAQKRLKGLEEASKNPGPSTTTTEAQRKTSVSDIAINAGQQAVATQLLPPGAKAAIELSKFITSQTSN